MKQCRPTPSASSDGRWMPAATMRTSVTMGAPSRNASTPAATAPAREDDVAHQFQVARGVDHAADDRPLVGGERVRPDLRLDDAEALGQDFIRPHHRALLPTAVAARRHDDVAEAARLGIADDDRREHIDGGLGHAADGGDLDRLARPEGVAHDADRRLGRPVRPRGFRPPGDTASRAAGFSDSAGPGRNRPPPRHAAGARSRPRESAGRSG